MAEFTKNCPECGGLQTYSRKSFLNHSIKLNKRCRSCMFKSKEYRNKHRYNSIQMWLENKEYIVQKRNMEEAKQKWHKSSSVTFATIEYKEKQKIAQRKYIEEHPEKVSQNSDCIKRMWGDKNSVFHTEEFREKLRNARIKQIEKLGIFFSNYNPAACKYFDLLSNEKGWKLQHALNGGEIKVGGYFVDAYDKENRIVVEYDESHHYDAFGNLTPKDKIRQERIINKLNPQMFLRYNEAKQNLYEVIVRKDG